MPAPERTDSGGQQEEAPPWCSDFDVTKPSVARVYDVWLGGKDNFEADRELAEQMLRIYPLTAKLARDNRTFLSRAVGWVAGHPAIRSFPLIQFAADVAAGRVPSIRAIRSRLRVGQPRAQQVRAYLAALAGG
jgi:hypothetical protein